MEPRGGAAMFGALLIMTGFVWIGSRLQPSAVGGWRKLERWIGLPVTCAPAQRMDLLQHRLRHSEGDGRSNDYR